ncbi:MAG: hypothetical protein HFH41_07755 [Lachnospiraceae bacterium]|nr:hypothetical protein [Lachnospiraceae bacterium]
MVKKMKRAIIAAIISAIMVGNVSSVYAKELCPDISKVQINEIKGKENTEVALGKLTEQSKYYKINIKSPGKIKLKVKGLKNNQTAFASLCKNDPIHSELEGTKNLTAKVPSAVYYIRKPGIYYFWINCIGTKNAYAAYTFSTNKNEGGSSYSKATTLKKNQKRVGVIGFDTTCDQRQYYKFTISKEELVKIKIAKGDSCANDDTMQVDVYKLNNKKRKHIIKDRIYEDQNGGTLYIRNSKKYKTQPGTYYIAVSKITNRAAFDYSLTWLKE